MNRRRGGVAVQDSPLDRSYAYQAVLNPILAPCWTIFESILDNWRTKLAIFFKPTKLNLENFRPDEHRHVNVHVHETVRSHAHDRCDCQVNDNSCGCPNCGNCLIQQIFYLIC